MTGSDPFDAFLGLTILVVAFMAIACLADLGIQGYQRIKAKRTVIQREDDWCGEQTR